MAIWQDNVIWVAGMNGTVAVSKDDGESWESQVVPGTDSLDFRDLEILNESTIVLMAAGNGSKSKIYRSIDGGKNWESKLTNPHEKGFFSGMTFMNDTDGMILSDPVDGYFVIWSTRDGGNTWTEMTTRAGLAAKDGEYAFAASGTCITSKDERFIWFVSGGSVARVFLSNDAGKSWQSVDSPIPAGSPGSGIFSIAFADRRYGMIVGGDYQNDMAKRNQVAITKDGGITWKSADPDSIVPYVSCVTPLKNKSTTNWWAVGPQGVFMMNDTGWTQVSKRSFHTIVANSEMQALWMVGKDGVPARLNP